MSERAVLFQKIAHSYMGNEGWSDKEPQFTDDGYPQEVELSDGTVFDAVYAGSSGCGCWIHVESAQFLRPIAWRDNELTESYKKRKGIDSGYI